MLSTQLDTQPMDTRPSWCVLGGGMLGISLALELAEGGNRVTLCEGADHLGGLADAWQLGEVVWDRHYHVVLLSDDVLRGLLRQLGLEQEIRWVAARTGFFSNGRLFSLSGAIDFLRFPVLRLHDKIRLAITILHASRLKDRSKLESIPVEDWLTAWSGQRTFDKIWAPLLRSKLGNSYGRVSAAFIWTIIRRLYRARQQGLRQEMFGYVPGGYARILARLSERLQEKGVTVCLNKAAKCVRQVESGGICIDFADGTQDVFASAALTMPAAIAASLCPALTADEQERLAGIEYQGIVCASLLLRQPLANYYVTNITDGGLPFTGVIEMTALVDRAEFGGHTLVYLPQYVAPDDASFELPDEAIRERCLAGLSRMYPHFRTEDVVAFAVSRARRVFALPTLNYSKRLPKVQSSIPGVYILNTAHIVDGTLNVDETVRLAKRWRELFPPPVADKAGTCAVVKETYEAVC